MSDVIKDRWTEALEVVRDHIISAINTDYSFRFGAPSEAGRNVHLDFLPPRLHCWAIFSGGGSQVAHTFSEAPPGEFVMPSRIEGRFKRSDDARAFCMMVAGALPVRASDHVQWFRMVENPSIAWDLERLANDKADQVYWKAVIPCLLVFGREDG